MEFSFAPIVVREMRVLARGKRLYLLRSAAAVVGALVAITALLWAGSSRSLSVHPGQFVFLVTSVLAFSYALGAGLLWTADAISSERRQGTLGLLFLTRIGSFDIVSGKLAANGWPALFNLLALLPVLAISFSLGAVNTNELLLMFVALINLLFFSCTLGIFVSAIVKSSTAGILLFSLLMLLPSLFNFATWIFTGSSAWLWTRINPLIPPLEVLKCTLIGFAPWNARPFWESLTLTHLVAWLWFLAASVMLPWIWRRETQMVSWQPKWPLAAFKTAGLVKPGLRSQDPILYLASRKRSPTFLLFTFSSVMLTLLIWDPIGTLHPSLAGISGPVLLHYALKLVIAWDSANCLSSQKDERLLELLLTTPITSGLMIKGQQSALRRRFIPLVIVVLVAHAICIFKAILTPGGTPVLWIVFGSGLILFLDYFALSWVGLWQGLMRSKPAVAFSWTISLTLFLPWLPFLLVVGLLWFVIGKVVDLNPLFLFAWGWISAGISALAIGLWGLAQAHLRFRSRILDILHP